MAKLSAPRRRSEICDLRFTIDDLLARTAMVRSADLQSISIFRNRRKRREFCSDREPSRFAARSLEESHGGLQALSHVRSAADGDRPRSASVAACPRCAVSQNCRTFQGGRAPTFIPMKPVTRSRWRSMFGKENARGESSFPNTPPGLSFRRAYAKAISCLSSWLVNHRCSSATRGRGRGRIETRSALP